AATRIRTLKVLRVLERIVENYARAAMLLSTEQKQPVENVACRRGTTVCRLSSVTTSGESSRGIPLRRRTGQERRLRMRSFLRRSVNCCTGDGCRLLSFSAVAIRLFQNRCARRPAGPADTGA